MNSNNIEFRSGVISPVACYRSGWHMIKDQYWLFVGITITAVIVGSIVPFGILMGPMLCGLYLCLFQRMQGARVKFELLFKGFDFFKNSLIAVLIQVVPFMIIYLPLNFYFMGQMMLRLKAITPRSGQARPEEAFQVFMEMMSMMAGYFGVIMVFAMLLGIFFIFTFPLIVDRGLSGVEALKTSCRAGASNFGGLLGLVMLSGVFSILGMSCCYVGAILIMPISFAAFAAAYRQVFPKTADYGNYPGYPDQPVWPTK
jgi:hypothetical protein